jgi:spore coat polysaccharide biosynthesis protein SpsF
MILAILQARVGSSRLHGKVLKEVLGKPLIQYEIERIKRSKKIDKLVLATSDREEDKQLTSVAGNSEIESFPGSENDVLDRYYQCARLYNPDAVVRLTGDMPIHDPDVIDKVITIYEQNQVDYVSNTYETSYPDGLDTEVMEMSALEMAYKEATLPSEREHVTPYIYNNANSYGKRLFKMLVVKNGVDFSHLRWTIDEEADFLLIKEIIKELYPSNPCFTWMDVISLLAKRPELLNINNKIERNEGFRKSLIRDEEIKSENES